MIEVEGLRVRRGDREVVCDIGFDVPAGQCLAVVGPNGSGKSTLLAALAGDLPHEGSILVGGNAADAAGQARVRAVMTQQTAIAFGFTVREVVAMGRAPWRGTAAATHDEAAIATAITAADVGHLLDRPVNGLSGGELARVAFARLLAQETPVVLLDEPTAALDLKHQVALLDALRARADSGASAVIVLHDLTLAAAVADQVLVLDGGELAALGTPESVLVPHVLEPVYGVPVEVLAGGRVVVPAAWTSGQDT